MDFGGKERPCVHSPPPPAQPQQAYEPTEAEQRAAAHAARQHQQATAPTPIVPENTPTVDETAPKPSVAATEKTTSRQSGPADDPMSTGLPDWLQPFEPLARVNQQTMPKELWQFAQSTLAEKL